MIFRAANNENMPEIQGKYRTSAWFLNRVGRDHNEVVLAMIPPIKKKNYRVTWTEAFINSYMAEVESTFQQSKQLSRGQSRIRMMCFIKEVVQLTETRGLNQERLVPTKGPFTL